MSSNVLIYGETPSSMATTIKCSPSGNLIVDSSTAVVNQVNNNYFTGDLVSGIILGTIDLEGRNTIQFGGKSNTQAFSFIMEFSNDEINWTTDGYQPEITNIENVFLFNITRTAICMKYIRLRCISDGLSVFIQYTAIKE